MKDMKNPLAAGIVISICLLTFFHCNGTPAANQVQSFYVDSENGSDVNNGRSPQTAWKSLSRVNRHSFPAGSALLFKRGTRYTGRLHPSGSGRNGHPIIIDTYGEGLNPRIDAQGKYGETLLLENQQYWEINNLELTNFGSLRKRNRYGVRITASNTGTLHHIHLKGLYIHDVNGTLQKENRLEGHGIFYENTGIIPSCFNDLLIQDCLIEHVDRNGIGGHTFYRTYQNIRNLKVIIRNNTLIDIGGDGIKVKGCDGALVEHNLVKAGSQRHDGFSCGIWPVSTINSLFQYNEVCFMKSTRDGQAFDSDFDCRNNTFQYNYSHDNEGGFFLIFTRYISRNNIGNDNTIIRYNISQNDQARTFLFGGPLSNLHIYNNVIYIKENLDVSLFHFAPQPDARNREVSWGTNIHCFNNIIVSNGMARLTHNRTQMKEDGTYEGVRGAGFGDIDFEANIFFGNFDYPFWPGGNNLKVNPLLAAPGTGGMGFASLNGYKILADSPCVDKGIIPREAISADFWGNPVPYNGSPDTGVHEVQ